jgi:hypothetical protein
MLKASKNVAKQSFCRRCMTTTTKPPEVITADAALAALFSQLPRGESWDRQPEDLRLMNGTDQEPIVRSIFLNFCLFQFINSY